MGTQVACLVRCHAAAATALQLSPRRLFKVVIGIAFAVMLMYGESWAITQAPLWSSACDLFPARNVVSEVGNHFGDTPGPVAVLH